MIRCIRLRRCEKKGLRGFVDLELSRTGLVLRDCCLHEKIGQRWITLPACPYAGSDGTLRRQPIVEFSASANREQFQRQAIAAIDVFIAQNPEPAS
jgi:hypothetical protein